VQGGKLAHGCARLRTRVGNGEINDITSNGTTILPLYEQEPNTVLSMGSECLFANFDHPWLFRYAAAIFTENLLRVRFFHVEITGTQPLIRNPEIDVILWLVNLNRNRIPLLRYFPDWTTPYSSLAYSATTAGAKSRSKCCGTRYCVDSPSGHY